MAKLKAKARNALPSSAFAGPDRSYPINDPNHARAALSMVSKYGTGALKAQVRAKVHAKYPEIGKNSGGACFLQGDGEPTKGRLDRPSRSAK
jgi:hypothetical protein